MPMTVNVVDICECEMCGKDKEKGVMCPDGDFFCDDCAPKRKCPRCKNVTLRTLSAGEWEFLWCDECEHNTPE